jgi:hypothetical protein
MSHFCLNKYHLKIYSCLDKVKFRHLELRQIIVKPMNTIEILHRSFIKLNGSSAFAQEIKYSTS